MAGRIKFGQLMQREDLRGEVVKLFPSGHTGIIRGMTETTSRSARIRSWWDSAMGSCL